MTQILSDLAGRYRRNTIVAAFVILMIVVVPGVDFSDAGFFGVKVGTTGRKSEIAVLCVLLLILAYQVALFLFYACGDIRDAYTKWQRNMPLISVLFDMGVSKKEVEERGFVGWEITKTKPGPHRRNLSLTLRTGTGSGTVTQTIALEDLRLARRSLYIFVGIDLFIPMLLAVWAVVLTLCRLSELTPALGDFFCIWTWLTWLV